MRGGSIKNDVSVPVSRVAEFIERAEAAVKAACPGIRPTPFGHVGDGDIHFNLSQPEGADGKAYLDRRDEICHVVKDGSTARSPPSMASAASRRTRCR